MNAGSDRRFPPFFSAILLWGTLTLAAVPGNATLRPDDVTVYVAPDSLFAGERLHYIVSVRHDPGQKASLSALESGDGSLFVVTGRAESSRRLSGDRMESVIDSEIAVFGRGRYTLPAFTVTLTGPDGGRRRITPRSTVTVLAMTDSTITTLRPARPVITPSLPGRFLFALLAIVLFIGLLFVLAGRIVRRFNIKADPVRLAKKKLRQIDRQLTRGLSPAAGYEAVSNILRDFLQNRYGFRAMELVTQEIDEELLKRQTATRDTVLQILQRADLVKFAGLPATAAECRSSISLAVTVMTAAAEEPVQVVSEPGEA